MVSVTVTLDAGTQIDVVALTDAKDHLNITHSHQDGLIQTYIDTAVSEAEGYTTRSLKKYNIVVKSGRFVNGQVLTHGPIAGDVVITYIDTNKATQTLASTKYDVLLVNGEPQVIYNDEANLPKLNDQQNAVTITYSTGYATAADVPKEFKQFIKLLVGTMYDNRTDSVDKLPRYSYSLIRRHRAW